MSEPQTIKKRIESIDTFRGVTIFAMIFVIMTAGYHNLPLTFPQFGSAPVTTFKHAGDDGDPDEWAFWEGKNPSTIYRQAKILDEGMYLHGEKSNLYNVALLDEKGNMELILDGVKVWTCKPLHKGEDIIAVSQSKINDPYKTDLILNERTGPPRQTIAGALPSAGRIPEITDNGDYKFQQQGIGCTFTDWVAPFFVFIVGLCLPLSRQRRGSDWWKHVGYRTLGLIIAGVIYISLIYKLSYYWGILQAIGIAYFMGAVFMLLPSWKRWIAVILIAAFHSWATWHISWWVEIGDKTKPFWTILTPEGDKLKPLIVHCTPWASISYGICTIIGTILGETIATRDTTKIIRQSLLIGIVFTFIGYLLHVYQLPMNKDYVSSSYTLFTSGLAAFCFLIFYLIIDVAGIKWWTGLFNVFGVNALLAYFMQPIVRIFMQALGLYQGLGNQVGWSGMLAGLEWTMILWCCVWICNKKNVYWKL